MTTTTLTPGSSEASWRGHPRLRGGQPPHPHQWSPTQMKALAAICETFVPSISVLSSEGVEPSAAAAESQESLAKAGLDNVDAFYKLSSSDVGLPVAVAGNMFMTLKPKVLKVVGIVLWMLTSSFGTVLLFGTVGLSWRYPFIQSFVDLSLDLREKALQNWMCSSVRIFCTFFKLFKAYVFLNFYGKVDENGHNPAWNAIGYCGPDPKASRFESCVQKPLEGKVLDPAGNSKEKVVAFLRDGGFTLLDDISHLHDSTRSHGMEKAGARQVQGGGRIGVKCDVVVVGSGSGGGVIAGALATAGHKVLVLEKGGYFARGDLSLLEVPTFQTMYEGGLLSTDDANVSVLAGSAVGGGSAINWGASLQTPDHVRQEWAKDLGLSVFATKRYQDALDKVCARGSVRSICEHESFQNAVLTEGCKRLGYDTGQIPRNAQTEHLCGWCHLGCKAGEKQATSETWLVDAVQSGALILSNCMVQEVLHNENYRSKKGRKAVGVVATCGENLTVYVEAAITVVCGGSLNTPPLLLRSGLSNPNIGRHLHLHPVVMGWGYFPEGKGPAGSSYEGAIMTSISKEAANWSSSGYGALLEVPIMHSGSAAALIPWRSATDHKGRMRKYSRTSFFIVLTRDQGSGRVGLTSNDERVITYSLAPEDENSILQALEKGLRAMVAAGAEEVGDVHFAGDSFKVRQSSKTMEDDFKNYLIGLKKRGLEGIKTPLCSAHQMGSCRMGVNSKQSVVDANAETWEVEDLFIGDASVFPTASGVNPMITVQAIAYCTAQNIMLKLQDRKSTGA
ncbi:unnamed protein product [Calypogeia fissa]